MRTQVIKSYGKINLCLDLNGLTDNGYHLIDTVMAPIECHDTILLSELKKGLDYITVDDQTPAESQSNLCTKVLKAFEEKYKIEKSFRVFIHKVLPIEAGLGSGSSNCAFLIKGVNKYCHLNLSDEEINDFLKLYGCDIPFFVNCTPSRCTHLGEEVAPITIKNDYYVLLIKPGSGCSTKTIYQITKPETNLKYADAVVKALEEGNDDALESICKNGLEEAAISQVPTIAKIKQRLYEFGAKIVFMTGSGSAVAALSQSKDQLKKIAKQFDDDKYIVILTKIKK